MTIRLRSETNRPVEPSRVAAIITRALLNPAQDDCPEVVQNERTGMGWVHWSDSLGASPIHAD